MISGASVRITLVDTDIVCSALLEPQYNMKAVTVHICKASMASRAMQRHIAVRTDASLSDLPLEFQRRLVKIVFTVSMHRQQQQAPFGSDLELVKQHFPDWPLPHFNAPRGMSTADLEIVLPYLVRRAGIERKINIDQKLQDVSSGIDRAYEQTALNIVATAFREANRAPQLTGELFVCCCLRS